MAGLDAKVFAMQDVTALLLTGTSPQAWMPWLSVLACLGLAALLVRVLGGRFRNALGRGSSDASSGSTGEASGAQPGILIGRRTLDGALFPLLAWLFVWIARQVWLSSAPGPAVAVVFKVTMPVLISLALIRLGVRILQSAFPRSTTVRLAERWLSWLAWLMVVLWVTGLGPLLLDELESIRWHMGGVAVSVRSLIEGVLTAGCVLLLALWLSSALESRLLQAGDQMGVDLSLRKIAANGIRALLVLLGVLMALSAAGIPLGALSVLGGAIGVGIGFGLQKLAANYVSGFVILAERALRIGDLITVDGFEGRITDIHTRFTVVRALNGREAVIPNELLMTQKVINASLTDRRVVLQTVVQVPYGTDLDALLPQLLAVVRQVPRVLAEPSPAVLLSNFAADGLELTVVFWIGDPENGDLGARSAVNLAVLRELQRQNIDIPYPQQVVHHAAEGGERA
jgi:small-conductance mechanosensitive channel